MLLRDAGSETFRIENNVITIGDVIIPTIPGTAKGDTLSNTTKGAMIDALAGNDKVTNSGNSVIILAGTGNDTITNSGEEVSIDGAAGADRIENEGDAVTIEAGAGKDLIITTANEGYIDGGAGISAGAVFGGNYKSRQIGRAIRYNKKYCADPRYCSMKSLIKTGDMYGEEFCYHTLPDTLDPFDRDTFSANPMEFYIGAVDVETGETRFHKCTDGGANDMDWMRASASMPLVSRVVEVDGFKMLDGGISCPVPYACMESLGYDRNLIVLTQPEGYRKKKSGALPLIRLKLRKYPALVRAMEERHLVYNRQLSVIAERERAGRVIVLRPPELLGISRTEKDPEELERVYQLGRCQAEQHLSEIRRFLEI